MHLALQNAETINRLVEQGEFLLKSFHDEHQKDPDGVETEFARGVALRSAHPQHGELVADLVDPGGVLAGKEAAFGDEQCDEDRSPRSGLVVGAGRPFTAMSRP